MLIDARTIPEGTILETEICIVGAGPAGLAIAREFIGQNIQVFLMEGGGIQPDPESQSLCEDETTFGQPCSVGSGTRCRSFGGTSNFWRVKLGDGQLGLYHRPLDSIDYEQRDWVPYSGWPFDRCHLIPYYEQAQKFCRAGPFAYHIDDWETEQTQRLPLDPELWLTNIYQFGPRDVYSVEYRQEIQDAPNITTYLYANVLEIETDEFARRVSRLKTACLNGTSFWVSAKTFILATGGVESAQLLLLSNQVQKTGLGNGNDLVGRFFMEHPQVYCGSWAPPHRQFIHEMAFYDFRSVNKTPILGKLALSEQAMRQEHLLNVSAILLPRPKPYQTHALFELKSLIYDLTSGTVSKDANNFTDESAALKAVLKGLWKTRKLPERFFNRLLEVLLG